MFSSSTHNLYCYSLTILMIKSLYYFTKSTPSQSLQQLIAVSNLLMLLPNIPSFEIVLAYSSSDADIIHCFLIDEFDALILR